MPTTQIKQFNTKKNILLSAIIAFVVCTVCIIKTLSDTNSNNWFYVFILGIPFFFISAFLACFVFIIFKHYNKMVYFFSAVVVLVGFLGFSSLGDFFIRNLLINKRIPKEYQNYHSLATNKSFTFGNYIVKLFITSDFATDQFVSSKNNLIIVTYKESQDNSSDKSRATKNFYKLNRSGNIISSYTKTGAFNDEEIIIGDYFMNPSKGYYKSWIIDNDTIQNPFIIQNKDQKWGQNQENQLLKKIRDEAKCYYKTFYFLENKHQISVLYFLDDKWYQFFTDFEDIPILESNFGVQHMLPNSENKADILPVYLKKEKYGSFDVPYGAMQPGYKTVNTLETEFYCHLYLRNDTLKFKMPITLFADNNNDKIFWDIKGEIVKNHQKEFKKLIWDYDFFSNGHFDFVLFKSSTYNLISQNNLYIIKPIK